MMNTPNETATAAERHDQSYQAYVAARVGDALEGLRFGTVTVTIQDGVALHVKRTDKVRLRSS